VRRFGAYQISPSKEMGLRVKPQGHSTYLAGKLKGERSMLRKRLSQKVCMTTHRKSCAQEASKEAEVKSGLIEPKSPVVQAAAHRSISEAMISEYLSVER
jgi:hypothetical protein